jgi:hypothetical protein
MHFLGHIEARWSWITVLALALMSHCGLANTLLQVRIGPHRNFDRIVFEFESEVASRIEIRADQTIEVRFDGVSASPTFALPPLPRGLSTIMSLKAFREGNNSLVFEIPVTKEASPSKLTLPGRPWRLAIDIAARTTQTESEPVNESKPDYIPGDRPIPTKMAEEEVRPEYIPGDQPIPTKLAGITVFLSDSLDPVKVRAVLAYFYLAVGDSVRANAEAAHYQQLTGRALDLSPEFDLTTRTPSQPKQIDNPITQLPSLLYIVLAFVAGLIGGILAAKLFPRMRIHLPRVEIKKSPATPRDQAEELEADLQMLHAAVESEQTSEATTTATIPVVLPVAAEMRAFKEEGTRGEDEIKETLMDRRVRRVLELSKQGHNIQSIAQELEMGQDEVKLILDLNQ